MYSFPVGAIGATMATRANVTDQMLAAMRVGEVNREWVDEHPEVLEAHRGEWVVVHEGRVVAHSPDGVEAARVIPERALSGALLEYVPTRAEADAVHLHTPYVGPPYGPDTVPKPGAKPSSP